jgi:hypothetical protein
MFVLNPGASGSKGAGGGDRQTLVWFWGQLAIYFVAIRGAYLFFSRDEQRSIKEN